MITVKVGCYSSLIVFYGTADSLQNGSFSTGDCCLDNWRCYFIIVRCVCRRVYVCACVHNRSCVWFYEFKFTSFNFLYLMSFNDYNQEVVSCDSHQV